MLKNIYINIYNFLIEFPSIVVLIFLVNHSYVFKHDIRWDHI